MTKSIFPFTYIHYYVMSPHWLITYLCSRIKKKISYYTYVKQKTFLYAVADLIFSPSPKLEENDDTDPETNRIHRALWGPVHVSLRLTVFLAAMKPYKLLLTQNPFGKAEWRGAEKLRIHSKETVSIWDIMTKPEETGLSLTGKLSTTSPPSPVPQMKRCFC